MKMKLLGSVVTNPSDDAITLATLVRVVATAAGLVELKKVGGVAYSPAKEIYMTANSSIDLVKNSTDVISCTGKCSPIAYIS